MDVGGGVDYKTLNPVTIVSSFNKIKLISLLLFSNTAENISTMSLLFSYL